MALTSTTFKLSGRTDPDQKRLFAAIVERHRPAMDKVIEDARKLARDLREIKDSIRASKEK